MAKITYLLGAGASANKLPIVKGMASRVRKVIDILRLGKFYNETVYDIIDEFKVDRYYKKLVKSLVELEGHCQDHPTIDTYAKQLYLKGEYDKLSALKISLSFYFAIDQCFLRNDPNDFQPNRILPTGNSSLSLPQLFQTYDFLSTENKINNYALSEKFDARYELFLASILNDKFDLLPTDIQIVSWNYDNQFEIAYSEFIPDEKKDKNCLQDVGDSLNILNRGVDIMEDVKSMTKNRFNIFKVNGSAGLIDKSTNKEVLYCANNYGGLYRKDTFEEIFCLYKDCVDLPDKYKSAITFAWEVNEDKGSYLRMVKDAITNSETLVIIGYSFPFFNRNVDKILFSHMPNLEQVHIQDSVPEKIEERFKAILPPSRMFEHPKVTINHHVDLDQFFVPYSFQ